MGSDSSPWPSPRLERRGRGRAKFFVGAALVVRFGYSVDPFPLTLDPSPLGRGNSGPVHAHDQRGAGVGRAEFFMGAVFVVRFGQSVNPFPLTLASPLGRGKLRAAEGLGEPPAGGAVEFDGEAAACAFFDYWRFVSGRVFGRAADAERLRSGRWGLFWGFHGGSRLRLRLRLRG